MSKDSAKLEIELQDYYTDRLHIRRDRYHSEYDGVNEKSGMGKDTAFKEIKYAYVNIGY